MMVLGSLGSLQGGLMNQKSKEKHDAQEETADNSLQQQHSIIKAQTDKIEAIKNSDKFENRIRTKSILPLVTKTDKDKSFNNANLPNNEEILQALAEERIMAKIKHLNRTRIKKSKNNGEYTNVIRWSVGGAILLVTPSVILVIIIRIIIMQ
ncbi:hypothetical protein QYM36_009229 [Artemia franciscana]|uniref:Uncharacterized protein n=1 Tax=Artemia franciscana TaxID=6661 RepID=A0AA88KZE1_ARTSF|nr:hypothetical protein QYM36_009229 [Artemia franciscana]